MTKIFAAAVLLFVAIAPVASAASATDVPSCTITATPAAITNAESALLEWESTEGAIFAEIDNGIGAVAPDGQLIVSPNESTVYTFHSWNSLGEGGYCSVALTVDGNGITVVNGGVQPTVTLEQTAFHPASTQVVLSSVPYTGAESTLSVLFLLALALSGWYAIAQRKAVFA